MLASRDMASFVSQEAYERATCSLPETSSARDQSVALNLAVRDRTHALFCRDFLVWFCVSERFTIGELSHLPKSSSKPLCKTCPGRGGMVHLRKVGCSCGHVFVANHNKHLLESMHILRSFGAIVIELVKPRKEH